MDVEDILDVSNGDPWEKLIEIPMAMETARAELNNAIMARSKVKIKMDLAEARINMEIVLKPATYGVAPTKKVTVKDIDSATNKDVKIVAMREKTVKLDFEVGCCEAIVSNLYCAKSILERIIDGDKVDLSASKKGTTMAERRESRSSSR